MSTILSALRRLQKDRDSQDQDSLRGRTTWRPPKRRPVPWLLIGVAVLTLGGTGWLVVAGPSPSGLLEDALEVASNAVEKAMSAAKPTPQPETAQEKVRPPAARPPKRAAAAPRRVPQESRRAGRGTKAAARRVPVQVAQAEPPASAGATGAHEPAEATAQKEAPPPTPAPQAPPPEPESKKQPLPRQAAKPKPELQPEPAPSPTHVAEPEPVPARADPTPETKSVASDAPGSPDGFPQVVVTRVRWHPDPARREARVELDHAGPFDAREGDIIAGVMVRRIEPAAVEVGIGGKRALVSISR